MAPRKQKHTAPRKQPQQDQPSVALRPFQRPALPAQNTNAFAIVPPPLANLQYGPPNILQGQQAQQQMLASQPRFVPTQQQQFLMQQLPPLQYQPLHQEGGASQFTFQQYVPPTYASGGAASLAASCRQSPEGSDYQPPSTSRSPSRPLSPAYSRADSPQQSVGTSQAESPPKGRRSRRQSNKLDSAPLPPKDRSSGGVDLNSKAAETPNFDFVDLKFHHTAIHILETPAPVKTCLMIKRWLLGQFTDVNELLATGLLRMDGQELHLIDPKKPAHLVLLEDACHIDGDPRKPVTIIALLVKTDPRIRFFYNLLPSAPLFNNLMQHNCIGNRTKTLHAGTDKHNRLFTFLRESFQTAITIPHHPDYLAAQAITDYCPSIQDPETAFQRLEGNETLYFSHNGRSEPLDLSNDRYLEDLHPAERSLAGDVKLHCSDYLLKKRKFFHAFWKELLASKEKIGDGRKKVRTEAAHIGWVEGECGWRPTRAKKIVLAWKILGFLEERRYLPWLKAGGILEEVAEEEDEGEAAGSEEGAVEAGGGGQGEGEEGDGKRRRRSVRRAESRR